jgi:hypothetical protein
VKNRATAARWIVALSALLFAPLAEASLARTASPATEPPALTLAPPATEPSGFFLFDGDELARTGNDRAQSFHPLAAVSLLPEDASLDLAPELETRYPKTRVWAIDVLGSTLVSRSTELSLETHWACGDFSCGLASGGRKDPLGLCLGFFNGEPCSATAARADRALDKVKKALRIGAESDAGAVVEAFTDSVVDAAKLFLVDPLRAGEATGTAIGSGASVGETALAVVQDVGRASALAAGAGTVVKVAGKGAGAVKSLTRFGNELGEARAGLTKGAAEGISELAPTFSAPARGRFPQNAVAGTAREQTALAELNPNPGQILKQRTIFDEGGRALFQGKGRRLDAVRVEDGVVTGAFEITSPGEALRARKIRQIFRGDELISREGSYVLGPNGEKIPFAPGLQTTVITRP